MSAFTLSYNTWCRTKQCFVRHCINTTFTLSFRAKTFCTTTIYILFSPEVKSVQLVLKLDTAHFVHMIWMTGGLCAIYPSGLAKPRPVIRTSYQADVHIGEKDFVWDDSHWKQRFNHRFTIHFCIRSFSIWRSHYRFMSYSHASLVQNVVSYDSVNARCISYLKISRHLQLASVNPKQ